MLISCNPASKTVVLVCGLVVSSVLAGCGGPSGPPRMAVKGTVSIDGQPLPAGMIRFIPVEPTKGPAAAGTVKAGEFSLSTSDGPIAGKHRIEIEASDFQKFAIDDEQAYSQAHQQTGGRPLPPNPVPPQFNQFSTLVKDVTPDGPNEFEFKLQTGATASR